MIRFPAFFIFMGFMPVKRVGGCTKNLCQLLFEMYEHMFYNIIVRFNLMKIKERRFASPGSMKTFMAADAATILSVYSGVLTLLIGVIGFFLVRTFRELDNKISAKEFESALRDIEKNTDDIRRIKDNYLTKDDFFREQTKTEKKLDDMLKILMDLSKNQ